MIYPELTKNHMEFRERVQAFARDVIEPRAREIDETSEFPEDTVKRMGEEGFMGIPFPETYGGAGLDVRSYIIAVEELSRVCGSTGITLAAHTSLGCMPVYMAGSEEQKQTYLVPMARGEKIGAFGLTEPNAGSDAAGTETLAVRDGERFVVNGNKRFITSGRYADIVVFTASQDRSKGTHGISAFIVERGTPGFSAPKDEHKMGLRGSNTSELLFEDCEIPAANLLGEEGEGFKVFMMTLDGGRVSIGALALGIAQGALDSAIEYVRENERFGTPLKKNQTAQRIVADMATEIEAARQLVYQAAWLEDQHEKFSKQSAMAKLYASEVCMRATTQAVGLLGAHGLTSSYPVERFFRDAKLTEIGEGTSEIQRIVIARQILGR
jgi:butyryl-CoA dehydrogenase